MVERERHGSGVPIEDEVRPPTPRAQEVTAQAQLGERVLAANRVAQPGGGALPRFRQVAAKGAVVAQLGAWSEAEPPVPRKVVVTVKVEQAALQQIPQTQRVVELVAQRARARVPSSLTSNRPA